MQVYSRAIAFALAVLSIIVLTFPLQAQYTPASGQTSAEKMRALGLLPGEGDLQLGENLTRAELVTVLIRSFGQESNAALLQGAPSFSDVDSHWASGYIALAKSLVEGQNGELGLPGGTFSPDGKLSSADAIAFLMKFLGVPPDSSKPWPSNYIQSAVEAGLISSDDASLLDPNTDVTRGLAFYLLDSAFKNHNVSDGKTFYTKYVDQEPPVVTVNPWPQSTDASSVTLTGTVSGQSVLYVSATQSEDAVTPDASGNWTATLPLALGENAIWIQAKDLAGNVGTPSTPVRIQRLAPMGPPAITHPIDGGALHASTVEIRGNAAAVAGVVEVFVDGASVGTTTIDTSGEWTLTRTLSNGAHTVYATVEDSFGAQQPSDTISFNVSTVSLAVSISSPAPGAAFTNPPATISGSATPGSTVTVVLDGFEIGTATAADDGSWSTAGDAGLAPGSHVATATASMSGSSSTPATVSFTLLNDRPFAFIVTPETYSVVRSANPSVSISGDVGVSVTLTVDGTFVGRAVFGPSGSVDFPLPAALGDGRHAATAIATDANGVSGPACTNIFFVDTQPLDGIRVYFPEPGMVIWGPTRVSGLADPNSQIEVTVPGITDAPWGPSLATPDAEGKWTAYLPSSAADGTYTMTVRDLSGTLPTIVTRSFTVDGNAPSWPVGSAISSSATTSSLALSWPAATDNLALDHYLLRVGDVEYEVPPSTTTFTVTGLMPGTYYAIWLYAVDRAGNTAIGPMDELPTLSVTTEVSVPGSPLVGVTGGGATCSITNLTWAPGGPSAAPPAGISFPVGVVDVRAGDCLAASFLTLRVVLDEPMPAGSSWWKYGPTPEDPSPHWYKLDATFNGTEVLIPIVDGGLGDDDLTINGVVTDPGGPAAPASEIWTSITPLVSTAGIGLPVSYVITVSNLGPETASDVVASHTLPAGFELASVTPTQGTCSGTPTITCAIGSLPLGAFAYVTITARPQTLGVAEVGVSSTSTISDPNLANNSDTASFEVVSNVSTTTLATSPNPSLAGQAVTFTATVSGSAGVATGSVSFTVDGIAAGTSTLNASGIATVTVTTLAAGSHTVLASYPGDANYGPSTASATQVVADPAVVTSTSVTSSPNPSIEGEPVTLSATVTGSGTPTGLVTFTVDGVSVGTATLNAAGIATLTISSMTEGSHAIVASYAGDATFDPSTSASLTHNVSAAAANVTNVPTLDPRALLILAIAMAAAGLFVARR